MAGKCSQQSSNVQLAILNSQNKQQDHQSKSEILISGRVGALSLFWINHILTVK